MPSIVLLLTLAGTCISAPAFAQRFAVPHRTFSPDQGGQIISGQLGTGKHNQPAMVDGALLLTGNATFSFFDISNPIAPTLISEFVSPYADGEAESHSISFARYADGRVIAATISGRGIDLWDVSDVRSPSLSSSVFLEGVRYGDRTEAVWGVHHQGRYVYVGGTNTGLHIVDAAVPEDPRVVGHLPITDFGGVSAGPLWAVGNLLVITTPKSSAGVATLDISDPASPTFLDAIVPEQTSYIGGFFGGTVYLINPLRAYDVTSDPREIAFLGSHSSVESEYMNFGNGRLYLGGKRPSPGVDIYALPSPGEFQLLHEVLGRNIPEIDDQFVLPIGNLVVLGDDQLGLGSVLAVESAARDDVPPAVSYINPPGGSTSVRLTTRVGVSFSDQVAIESTDDAAFIVRRLGESEPLVGAFGHSGTLVTFSPSMPLEPDATYEVVIAAGGVADLVGNAITETFRSVFSTGANVTSLDCGIADTLPSEIGSPVGFSSTGDTVDEYTWEFGDGSDLGGDASVSHTYQEAGRYPVTLRMRRGADEVACTRLHIVHEPLFAPPSHSSTIAIDIERRRVVVVNSDADSVSILDADTHERVFEVPVGDEPRSVAIDQGVAWVTTRDDARLTAVDITTGARVAVIEMPYASQPEGVAISADGSRIYVSLAARGEVIAVDRQRRTIVAQTRVSAEGRPRLGAIAIDPNTSRILVAQTISGASEGTVYSLSAALDDVRSLALDEDLGPDTAHAGRGVPNVLTALAVSPSGRSCTVVGTKANTRRGLMLDGLRPNFDNVVRTLVSRLDMELGEERVDMRIDFDDRSLPSSVAYSARGDLLFVALMGSNYVEVLDAYTHAAVAGFTTDFAPDGLVLDGDERLFVHASLSRSVGVIDVSALTSGRGAATPRVATIATLSQEPLAADVLLGKQLFHNADDPRLSSDGYIACASCHLDGGEDGRVWDFTDRGEGLRNTISLQGRAGTRHGPMHWTANFDEVQDFENDIRAHFGGTGLMEDGLFHAGTRADALGDAKAGLSPALDALAAYVSSLDAFPRSPYRNSDGTMTDAATRGAEVFERARCGECHAGEEMTDSMMRRLHDVGTLSERSGMRRGEVLEGIDTPTLVGVWATAPYLHDGSAETLDEVLRVPRHGNGSSLTDSERADLVAYMQELELRPPPDSAGCGCQVAPRRAPVISLAALVLALAVRRRSRSHERQA